ncbi:MAG: murein biosynthesis integral membrane protein MurJ [Pseudomonadota bacterium]
MSKKLVKSVFLFSSNTLLSRVLGFARDMILAQLFGASAGLDAFLVAFRIPNFMRRLFAEGAFSQAFIPVLVDYRQQHSEQKLRQFIADTSGSLALILLMIVILGILIAPVLIHIFAPGFTHSSNRYLLANAMLRITFPYILLISLVALSSALLNTYGSFGVPAFTPVLLNLSLISCALFLAPKLATHIVALAWGVLIAGILQCLFLLPFLARRKLLIRPRINFKNPGVRRVLTLMGPAIVGVSVAQINLLVDMLFASFLATGSVSWLYYSERLMMFPLGIFGVAIATVILPKLSQHAAVDDKKVYSQTLDWALRLLLLIGLPSVLGLFFLANQILATLFHYKQFNAHDVIMSGESLMAFAFGLQGMMMIKVLASGFYAHKNIKTPVKIAVIAMVSNIIFNIVLIIPLRHAGIALATSLSALLNSALLWWNLKRHDLYQATAGWKIYLSRLLVANVLLAIFLYLVRGSVSNWLIQTWHWRFTHLLLLLFGAIILYCAALWLLGLRFKHFSIPSK